MSRLRTYVPEPTMEMHHNAHLAAHMLHDEQRTFLRRLLKVYGRDLTYRVLDELGPIRNDAKVGGL